MSLLLLFHGSTPPPVITSPWRWNGLLLGLHNPYASSGASPYLPNGLALTSAVKTAVTATSFVHGGATSTVTVKSGSRITIVIKSGQKDAVVL